MSQEAKIQRQAKHEDACITVSSTKFNQTDESKEYIQIRPFATDTARIGVKCGRTVNLGNFESARIDVMIEIPCYAEESRKVYSEVLNMTEELLDNEVNRIIRSVNNVKSDTSVEELL